MCLVSAVGCVLQGQIRSGRLGGVQTCELCGACSDAAVAKEATFSVWDGRAPAYPESLACYLQHGGMLCPCG